MSIVTIYKEEAISQWQTKWNDSQLGRRLYIISPNIGKLPWFMNVPFSRKYITTLCRLRFGHTLCGDHLFKINIEEQPTCECGNSIDTIEHIFFHCPLTDSPLREKLISFLALHNHQQPFDMLKILHAVNNEIYYAIAKYAITTKLKL